MGGGDQVAPPEPTAEEKDLQQKQADLLGQQTSILKQQYAQQQMLAPLLYKQAGLTPTLDAQGNITGFSQDANPNQGNLDLQNNINTQLLQREQDALQGKLPTDPSLTNELNTEDQTLNQTLQKNLGPGYATSTPGIQALAQQAQKRGELTYATSTGNLTTAAALAQAGQQSTSDLQSASLNRILATQGGGNQFASLYGQAAQGYGNALVPYQNQQGLSLNAAQSNQASSNAASQSKMAAAGAVVGIAAAVAI